MNSPLLLVTEVAYEYVKLKRISQIPTPRVNTLEDSDTSEFVLLMVGVAITKRALASRVESSCENIIGNCMVCSSFHANTPPVVQASIWPTSGDAAGIVKAVVLDVSVVVSVTVFPAVVARVASAMFTLSTTSTLPFVVAEPLVLKLIVFVPTVSTLLVILAIMPVSSIV